MFRELPSPVELEEEVLAFWREHRIFERSLEQSAGRPTFVFYEGPPTANGTPHNGHVLTRVIKDLLPRYKTMRGFSVPRKAGWDTHGLPVEIEVEKELGMRGAAKGEHDNPRDAVLAYGLDNFSRKCIASVFKYTEEWRQLTDQVGFWVDMDDAYVTYHRSYVESVWWALKTLFDKGLLYQGLKVVWWWPEGGTALSSGEVGEGYRDVNDPSVTVRFRVEGDPSVSFLAWTTTPWTLPSNVALAVHPELDYAWTRLDDGEVVITAAALAPDGETLKTAKGAQLVGMRYQRIYETGDPEGKAFEVVPGEHVTLGAGTGIVHTAPAYGEEDYQVRLDQGLGILAVVGPDGKVTDAMPPWAAGLHFKAADKPIMRDLEERGLLFERSQVNHSYPFSPRSKDDPLMQLARPGWFIRTTAFKEQALENNAGVNWLPEHIQDGRFGDFLRNNVDWALSRERFWGTPLPIWTCPDCGQMRCFGSVAELEAAGATGFATGEDPDLQVHKPWIDHVSLPCGHGGCGGTLERVTEVIDCWFDSGCMPFAQWGFPHQGRDAFARAFPADFISEAVDQTRGWFYSLLMISTMLFDDETCEAHGLAPRGFPRPYKNCVVLGHVSDMDGFKESKSKGNYTSPQLVLRGRMRLRVKADDTLKRGQAGMVKAAVRSIDLTRGETLGLSKDEHGEERLQVGLATRPNPGKETLLLHPDDIATLGLDDDVWVHAPWQPPGADAFRWLVYASNPPWTNTRLSLRAIREGQREFHLRLANVMSFFTIYATINDFTPEPARRSEHVLDRWIRGELAAVVAEVTEQLDQYRIYEAARAISAFVEGLSNWYVRRSRDRFWGAGDDTTDALNTLHAVLLTLSKVIAPFVPFLADALHGRLGGAGDSVHLCEWPAPAGLSADRDDALSADMALIRELASLGLAARARVGVKVRQPLRAAEVILAEPERADALSPLLPLLLDELNVREVRFTQQAGDFVTFEVKPNYKALGRELGKEMKVLAGILRQAEPAAVRNGVLGDGYTVELPSGPRVLTEADVVVGVQPREAFQAAGSRTAVVALHANLDDDLVEEGLAREVINRVQSQRKELDLSYTDRISVTCGASPALAQAIARFADHIRKETLALDLAVHAPADGREADDIDGHALQLDVRRLDV